MREGLEGRGIVVYSSINSVEVLMMMIMLADDSDDHDHDMTMMQDQWLEGELFPNPKHHQ